MIQTQFTELYALPFFTERQTAQLIANWRQSEVDHPPVAKLSLFASNKLSLCWLVYALDSDYPELATGLCDHGWGQAFRDLIYLPHLLTEATYHQTPLQRDDTFVGLYPVSIYEAAAKRRQRITTDLADLTQAYTHLQQRPPKP